MGFGDRSQYMLVAVPLAVRMLSWMWQTQWPFFVCWRRMQSLAWLQTSCSESQPNQFFYVLLSKQTSICVAYRKYWPQLICACILHKATENEQHLRTNTLTAFFLRLSSSSQNGKTLPCSKEQQKQAEPLMFPLWSFSSSGTQRHGLIFLEISFFFLSLSECMWSVWHCAAMTKPWAFYHTTTPFLLTLYVSSFTLLRKTKVLKLACWKTSSKAASFWILNKSSDIIL